MTHILGIETSCDETAASVVIDGKVIASNVVASQIDLHAAYGGVFPEVASRAHVEAIGPVVEQAMVDSGIGYDSLDAIAVTRGPGLVGSLLVGMNYAKGLALATGKPLLGINHLEGHVYSLWLSDMRSEPRFPILLLIISGGHTELLLMKGHGKYERLGGTLDDAAGEAFDKVGRLLGLPYPGGPHIERAAQNGNAAVFSFPRAKRDDSYDFSFSGLKTAVMREVTVQPSAEVRRKRKRGAEKKAQLRADVSVNDVAASFQVAVVEQIVSKTARAAKQYGVNEIFMAGGVSANQLLRAEMRKATQIPVRYPPLNLCTDNAAMIAAAAHYRYEAGLRDELDLDVKPMWPLTSDAYDK
ncbi:MAG: tRNA (adenosine(37)-N6)-threonylcarbamoyltransferase complex transferase subunit TsaD [Chloroflexi bacterium]|nr:MAG: tRNA (adenosine(37)-N6)-threonylcarbamoyltransferase complex transferase subunit TsaD [Chloroflexota bacterium]